MDVPYINDLLYDIIMYAVGTPPSLKTFGRCRRVSKKWLALLGNRAWTSILLRLHFPLIQHRSEFKYWKNKTLHVNQTDIHPTVSPYIITLQKEATGTCINFCKEGAGLTVSGSITKSIDPTNLRVSNCFRTYEGFYFEFIGNEKSFWLMLTENETVMEVKDFPAPQFTDYKLVASFMRLHLYHGLGHLVAYKDSKIVWECKLEKCFNPEHTEYYHPFLIVRSGYNVRKGFLMDIFTGRVIFNMMIKAISWVPSGYLLHI